MKKISVDNIQQFLVSNARPVDLAFYEYHFRSGSSTKVVDALAAFQNDDGGFGNAVEPDLRLPQSTALGTWMGFQFLKEIDIDASNSVLQRGLKYFVDTYDTEREGWKIVRPEVDDYPHAPWWTYETAMKHFGWGNPSAEILGFLMAYNADVNSSKIESLKEVAMRRIVEVEPQSFHEVFNFKALYMLADDDFKKKMKEPLVRLIKKAASENPSEWTSYVATPLKFVESPKDPFVELFDESLIQKNIDFIADQIVDGDHWEPNWDWSGTYPEEWRKAKQEWSGHLTVKNVRILKNFNQIPHA